MKKLFILLIIAGLFSSCSENKEAYPGYTISGNLENSNGQTLYLAEITTGNPRINDSTKIDADGNFRLRGMLKESIPCILYKTIDDPVKLVIANEDNITINGDGINLNASYRVSGSNECEKLQTIAKHTYENLLIIDSLNFVFSQMKARNDFDSILVNISKIADSIMQEQRSFLISQLESNPGTLSGYLILSEQLGPANFIFDIKKDFKYFEMVEKGLLEKFPDSKITSGFSAFVREAESTISESDKIIEEPKIGEVAPDIKLRDNKGNIVKLYDLRGKYVLINFWATWCKPCRMENPVLSRNYMKYKKSKIGFEIFQVSLDLAADKDEWLKVIKNDNMVEWIHTIDEDQIYAKAYNIKTIPLNYLIDKNGVIIAKNIMGRDLEEKLRDVFKF